MDTTRGVFDARTGRFGILDIEKNIGTGLLQMAMMFCRQGEVGAESAET